MGIFTKIGRLNSMAQSVKNILDAYFSSQENWKIQLLKNWDTIIGKLKDHVCLEKVYDDTVVLGVYNSHWMQELYLLSNVILKTINDALDKPRIKKIRFKHIETKKKKIEKKEIKSVQSDVQISMIVSRKELVALEKISDEQLRSVLYDFLMRCYRER